jgi:extradiol dioxygenase family protein
LTPGCWASVCQVNAGNILFGHQIVAHRAPDECGHTQSSAVDGHDVPVRLAMRWS